MLMNLFKPPGPSPEMSDLKKSIDADHAEFMTEAETYLNPESASIE